MFGTHIDGSLLLTFASTPDTEVGPTLMPSKTHTTSLSSPHRSRAMDMVSLGGFYSFTVYRNSDSDGFHTLGNNVEMAPLTQSGAAFGAANPTNVLNEIRDIGNGVNGIEQNLQQLRMLQDRALNETDSNSGTARQLDQLSADTMASYRSLVQRVRELKSKPDARSYQGQVDRIDRQLKSAIQQFQEVEASHRQKMQGQMERQYRIVRPDADQNEVRAAVEDMSAGGQQVFQQAMMQSNRQGQARAVLNEVQNRHRELLKIEQQMTELAQLMQDLDTIIVQQEEPLMKIEHQAEDTVQQLEEANVHLDKANETARATRRKKWICLGICGMLQPSAPFFRELN